MNALRLILAIVFILSISGCALGLGKSLHQYSALEASNESQLTGLKKVPITVTESRTVILSFVFNTSYADDAYQKLLDACPNGEVHQIRMTHSSELGFFAYQDKVRFDGICVGGPPG